MKTLLFFTDTETTGLVQGKDQILSYAMVFGSGRDTLLEKEIKIKIKKNVFPNASALIVNNLNPFSPEYLKEAISEYDAAHILATTLWEYKQQGYRIVLIAYNASFDVDMYLSMFYRCGINLKAIVDTIFDPLTMAKAMVQSGALKTREIQTGYGGKSYKSSKLEDVYNALGYSSESITAHNALEDTKMLRTAVYKLYYLFTGQSLEDSNVNFDTFEKGELKTLIVFEEMEAKIKTFKVLRKDFDVVVFLDYDKLATEPSKIKDAISVVNKDDIFDELDLDPGQINKVENYYLQNEKEINNQVDLIKPNPISAFATYEELYFDRVKKYAEEKIKDNKWVSADMAEISDSLAEEYAYAAFDKGWSVNLYGQNYLNESKSMEVAGYVVLLSVLGKYVLESAETKMLVLTTEKKTEILDFFKANTEATPEELKKLNTFLVPVKSFKSSKHPSVLINEFNDKKTVIFNGANKLHKEALKGLADHYKANNKEAFAEVTVPEFKLNLNIFKKS